jgi:MoaA/NifB/PqqE/SkfB family radical SAM enzyme
MANYTIDVELTNRCNADCYFCPRDATPHQGLMSEEVFEQTLVLAHEVKERNRVLDPTVETVISFCGLGEPLIHKRAADWVARAREEGFECSMSSNGALLDERRGTALLDAGLTSIYLNVGERDDDYADIYKLPYERTRDNIVRFLELAEDRCQVIIVLVDHRRDKGHVAGMERYWRDLGVTSFATFDIMNRGGALFVDHMQYETRPELARAEELIAARGGEAFCAVPFLSTFVGYDGNLYLCCSDWKKEAPIASVFDEGAVARTPKVGYVASREPVCVTCNLDPLNHLADEIRANDEGAADAVDIDELVEKYAVYGPTLRDSVARFDALGPAPAAARRRIPLRVQ